MSHSRHHNKRRSRVKMTVPRMELDVIAQEDYAGRDRIETTKTYKYTTTRQDLLNLDLRTSSNLSLRIHAENNFFISGEGGVAQVRKDCIERGFNITIGGQRKLGLTNDEIAMVSAQFDNDNLPFITQKLTSLLGNRQYAEHFIQAHSQGPFAFIPFILFKALPSDSTVQIKQPKEFSANIFVDANNQLICEVLIDALPIFDLEQAGQVGKFKGPFKVTFKMAQVEGKWGFIFESLETNNRDMVAIFKGERLTLETIRRYYPKASSIGEDDDNVAPITKVERKRKTPGQIAACSLGRFFDWGCPLSSVTISSKLRENVQTISDGIVFYSFHHGPTEVIHAFYPVCDSDPSPFPDTLGLRYALETFKSSVKLAGKHHALTIPVATTSPLRAHWLELHITINIQGKVQAKLTDSQYFASYIYSTSYIADVIRDIFDIKLQVEAYRQQPIGNNTDCGIYYLENSAYSLGFSHKRVGEIDDAILAKYALIQARYKQGGEVDINSGMQQMQIPSDVLHKYANSDNVPIYDADNLTASLVSNSSLESSYAASINDEFEVLGAKKANERERIRAYEDELSVAKPRASVTKKTVDVDLHHIPVRTMQAVLDDGLISLAQKAEPALELLPAAIESKLPARMANSPDDVDNYAHIGLFLRHKSTLLFSMVGALLGGAFGSIPAILIFAGILLLPATMGGSATMIGFGAALIAGSFLLGGTLGAGIGFKKDQQAKITFNMQQNKPTHKRVSERLSQDSKLPTKRRKTIANEDSDDDLNLSHSFSNSMEQALDEFSVLPSVSNSSKRLNNR